jgi:hypothetical protein
VLNTVFGNHTAIRGNTRYGLLFVLFLTHIYEEKRRREREEEGKREKRRGYTR